MFGINFCLVFDGFVQTLMSAPHWWNHADHILCVQTWLQASRAPVNRVSRVHQAQQFKTVSVRIHCSAVQAVSKSDECSRLLFEVILLSHCSLQSRFH